MDRTSADAVREAAAVLRRGGLVAFPTETVYGLGADARNAEAVARVFAVKGRPTGHPLIVHLGSADAIEDWAAELSDDARRLASAFWPGPLTLLVWRRADHVLDAVTGGSDRVGLRVPAHPVALALLDAFGGGIAAPSANRFGRVSPTTAGHVRADLGDDVDLVLDGGATEVGIESTIVDCTTETPEVVRLGGVSLEMLAEMLGRPAGVWLGDREVAAPGTLAAHYAPHAVVLVVERADDVIEAVRAAGGDDVVVGVLAPSVIDGLPDDVRQLDPAGPPDDYARVLYARLRAADHQAIDVLIAVPPDDRGIGRAVRDRLRRAAAGGAAPP